MARPLPAPDVPVIDLQSGKMTQVWFEYFQSQTAATGSTNFGMSFTNVAGSLTGGFYPRYANALYTSTYSATHADASATLAVVRKADGAGAGGSDNAAIFSSEKNNYLTSTISGDINGAVIDARQGRKGDSSGLLIDLTKVYTAGGTGGSLAIEVASRLFDTSGTETAHMHLHAGFYDGIDSGVAIADTGYGWRAQVNVGSGIAAFMATQAGGFWYNFIEGRTGTSAATRLWKVGNDGRHYLGTTAAQTVMLHDTATDTLHFYATDGVTDKFTLTGSGVGAFTGGTTNANNPTATWARTATGSTISVTNGGNTTLAAGDGILTIRDAVSGEAACYTMFGGVTAIIWQTAAQYVIGTTPAAGQVSVGYPGSGAAYKVYNNRGTTRSFYIDGLRIG